MYRQYSPVRNQRSKGIKIKHVVQLCLLVAVCFWLIFQVKRSHDKKKEFDANISLNTHAAAAAAAADDDEILKFGRKDLHPKLQETTIEKEDTQEDEDGQEENKHEEDGDKTEEEEDNGAGAGDDEIDENEQEKSNMEIDREEVDIIDEEDKETDGERETDENRVEDKHTHEAREEHYKADDASSAVLITHHPPENEIKNATFDDISSSGNVGLGVNETGTIIIQEKGSESINENEDGPPPNTTTTSTAYLFDSNAATVTEEGGTFKFEKEFRDFEVNW